MKNNKSVFKIIIFLIFIFIFFNNFFNIVFAVKRAEAGDIIEVPQSFPYDDKEKKRGKQRTWYQWYCGNNELDITKFNWGWTPEKLYNEWRRFGGTDPKTSLVYLPIAGVNWVFVATAAIFGEDGSYLRVHVKDDKTGQEKDYYMMKFDEKSGKTNGFFYNGVCWGHKQEPDRHGGPYVDVLEFLYHGNSKKNKKYRYDVMPVMYIQNGGTYFEHPDGPVGFTPMANEEYDEDPESSTIAGAVGQFFRNIWNSLGTFLDNHLEERDTSTLLFDLTDSVSGDLVWPLPGHTKVGSPFTDARKDPLGSGTVRPHTGIDIGAPAGTVEVAAGTGVIDTAGYFTPGSGYQSYLYLDDKETYGGEVIFGYLHTDPEPIEERGAHVYAGQPIAKVGPKWVNVPGKVGKVKNGSTTGPHLHFSMRIEGHHVDPEIYFPEEMRK